jgi:hypothetical protein
MERDYWGIKWYRYGWFTNCLGTGLYFIRTRFCRYVILRKCFCLVVWSAKVSESGSFFKHHQRHWQVEWVTGNTCSYSDCFDPEPLFDVDCCFFEQALLVEATLAQIYKEKHFKNFEVGLPLYREISVKWFVVYLPWFLSFRWGAAWSSSELCCRWNTECLWK